MNPKICTSLLLLLGLTIPALSDKCPVAGRLPSSCECDDDPMDDEMDIELSCSGTTVGELRDALTMFDTDHRLEVILDDMNLGDLPADLFVGSNVVKLDISHCEMNGLAPPGETPLQGLEDKLEVLVITSSFTEEERQTTLGSLGHLRRLRELDLSFNAITEVSDDWFSSPPPALEHLSLSNNGIEKIGDRAFAQLANLNFFELHGNRFGAIKRSMLPRPANQLEKIELDNNPFTSLPDDLFTDMPALRELSIRTNGITRLSEPAFRHIWLQLDVFDARGNPLECDSSMEWLFHLHKESGMILGTCEGPLGREGMDLEDFIESKGRGL